MSEPTQRTGISDNLFIEQRGDGIWLVCVEKVHASMEEAQTSCRGWQDVYASRSDRNAIEQPCSGCGKALLIENAWMEDGCPCNTPAGVNNHILYRWKLLHDLQQEQARTLAAQRTALLKLAASADENGEEWVADAIREVVK